jgi:hypothetical protein
VDVAVDEVGHPFEEAAVEGSVVGAAVVGEGATAEEAMVVEALRHEDGAASGLEATVVVAVLVSRHIERRYRLSAGRNLGTVRGRHRQTAVHQKEGLMASQGHPFSSHDKNACLCGHGLILGQLRAHERLSE